MSDTVLIGTYIVNRLKEIGIDTIFGVPGDCTLTFLDIIEDDPDMTWGNNTNELNAAYAADGYARIKGVGALCTVMGVGELSAINGVAGSYAEFVPVIHIVGYCSQKMQKQGALVHHSLANGDFDVFSNASSQFTVASTKITAENAISEIDRVIQTACRKKRPGYINIPLDLVTTAVALPSEVPQLQLIQAYPTNNYYLGLQNAVLSHIMERICKAKKTVVVADLHVLRLQMEGPLSDFVEKSGFPAFCTPMGKSAIYSHLTNYRGIFYGACTVNDMQNEVENADLIIEFGSLHSDLNTGGFTANYDQGKLITLNFDSISVHYTQYPHIGLQEMIPLLTEAIEKENSKLIDQSAASLPTTTNSLAITKKEVNVQKEDNNSNTTIITQDFLWNTLPQFMVENSIVVAEVGCSVYGSLNIDFPGGYSKYIQQGLWMSIGYTVPAALGACMADRSKTVYLFVGDGSFQLTAQEIAVFIRHGVTPVIILLNNDGYLVEKLLNGPHRSYNNFQMWNYSKSLDYFGGHLKINSTGADKNPSVIGVEAKVETCQGFIDTMKKVQENPNKIHFVEVILSQFDAPQALNVFCEVLTTRVHK